MPKRNETRALPIEGCRVSRLMLDYRFGLGFYEVPEDTSDHELFIGTTFSSTTEQGREVHDPERGAGSLGSAYSLLHTICEEAVTDSEGHLHCTFDNGVVLEVAPHDRFEAWELVELSPPPNLRSSLCPVVG